MTDIFFSIITPTYNRVNQLSKSINSVFTQTFNDYELIIIDDASTDDTLILLNQYSKHFKFITLVNKINLGVNKSKNLGSEIARGKYLIFLDSDDEFKDIDTLSNIYNIVSFNNSPPLLMFAVVDNLNGLLLHKNELNGFYHYKKFYQEKFLYESLPVVNREIFLSYKFLENIQGGEGLTWKLICKFYSFIYISNSVSRIYDNNSTDRLSYKSNDNIIRIKNVLIQDIKIFFIDYMRYNPILFLKILSKISYYKIKSIIN